MGRKIISIDWVIVIPIVILSFISLLTIASIQPSLFLPQVLFIVVGFFLFIAISTVDSRVFRHLAPILFGVSIVLLLLTQFGPEIRGSMRWLIFGPFRIQPSELVKPFITVFFAAFLARKHISVRTFIVSTALFVLPTIILFRQPDLGNVLVYLAFFSGMLLIAGIPLRFAGAVIGIVLFTIPFGYSLLQDYQRARIVAFLSPTSDPQGIGYNALQAIIAVGSGKLFGRGFGRGIQSHLRFLPENHTDFIFASFVEEFGFIGGCILILASLFLLYQILALAKKSNNHPFIQLYCIGLFIQIFIQIVINVGMNIGIVPITGITLPLVSYGGSSIIATFIGLGIFSAMKISVQDNAPLAIR